MGVEVYNSYGSGTVKERVDNQGITRNNVGDPVSSEELRNNDALNSNEARGAKADGKMSDARAYYDKVVDPGDRVSLYRELFGAKGDQSPPASMFKQESGGVGNPDALFYMMIFYLNSATPDFKWSDVLKAAQLRSNSNFIAASANGSFLPTSSINENKRVPSIGTKDSLSQLQAEHAAKKGSLDQDVKKNKDQIPTNASGKTDGGGVNKIVKWPIQNMPIITNGLNKTVDWKQAETTATTFAEPMFSINGGASNIDIELEFVYAVGLPGLGDNIPAEKAAMKSGKSAGNPTATSKPDFWTVEEVMGMAYLAMSLVLPYQSSKKSSNMDDKEKNGAPFFPVLFLRHCSLFPYLTPFVVKGVKIEPDEQQPLIITEKQAINQTDMQLDYASVRQTMKITLSLQSAHYYLTAFQGDESGTDIQKLTSGFTYLSNAKALLRGKV